MEGQKTLALSCSWVQCVLLLQMSKWLKGRLFCYIDLTPPHLCVRACVRYHMMQLCILDASMFSAMCHNVWLLCALTWVEYPLIKLYRLSAAAYTLLSLSRLTQCIPACPPHNTHTYRRWDRATSHYDGRRVQSQQWLKLIIESFVLYRSGVR